MNIYNSYYRAEVWCEEDLYINVNFGCNDGDDVIAAALQTANDDGYRSVEVTDLIRVEK